MVYTYIRISTDRQTAENQRFEIRNFCRQNDLKIDRFVAETVCGAVPAESRKLGKILRKLGAGDTLVVTELSRLGRNLLDVLRILGDCIDCGVHILTTKERFVLGDNLSSKVLAFAFGLSAEIERQLISERTREALAARKSAGIRLGRPPGSRSRRTKLSGREPQIRRLVDAGKSFTQIARELGVHRHTLCRKIREMGLRGNGEKKMSQNQRSRGVPARSTEACAEKFISKTQTFGNSVGEL